MFKKGDVIQIRNLPWVILDIDEIDNTALCFCCYRFDKEYCWNGTVGYKGEYFHSGLYNELNSYEMIEKMENMVGKEALLPFVLKGPYNETSVSVIFAPPRVEDFEKHGKLINKYIDFRSGSLYESEMGLANISLFCSTRNEGLGNCVYIAEEVRKPFNAVNEYGIEGGFCYCYENRVGYVQPIAVIDLSKVDDLKLLRRENIENEEAD